MMSRVLIACAVTVVLAGCGGGSEATTVTAITEEFVTVTQTNAVTQTATTRSTETQTRTQTVTRTVRGGGGSSTRPRPAQPARTIRFSGSGDTTLRPIRVGLGGANLRWSTRGSVFAVFGDRGPLVDSIRQSPRGGRHAGSTFLRPGRYVLQVVANGRWSMTAENASRPS
ncbi:MAG: hypothetical protein H0T39_06065 [Actinobacteria bacterium]|nr:hypothetical protein [Actinomycetota bacterium]